MQRINYFLICILMLTGQTLFAQSFSFSGQVKAKDSNDPLIGANVYFKGTTIGTATNAEGQFNLRNVKPGDYDVIVSYSGYHRIMENIEIKSADICMNFEMQESDKTLGEVVVTGTGTPHHLKNAPVQTELISKKLVQGVSAPSFTDLMSSISPSFDFSPNVMGSFMQLNGLGNDYILILVNGKRMYGDIGGHNDLNRINPDNIERIEVVKGASSSLYGSEAIAGVINIITKDSKQKVLIENNSRFSENSSWQQNNNLHLNLGRLSSTTNYSHKESDGWQLSKMEIDDDMDNTDPSDDVLVATDVKVINAYEDYTISQKFDYNLTDKVSVYLMGSKYEKDVTTPTSVKKYGYFYEDFGYSVGAKYILNNTDFITLDYNSDQFKYYYKYNQDYKDYVAGEKSLNTDQRREDLNLKYIFNLSKAHKISLGAEYVSEKLESEGRLKADKVEAYTYSVFAQDEINLIKNLSLVAGVRYVKHEEFGNSFTPKLSALYKLKDFNFRATYAKGFKAPTMKELYYHYEKRGKLYLGNTNLDPQTSDYYSASVEYINKKMSISLSAYRNNVEDMINYQTIETSDADKANGIKSTKEHYNIGEAQSQGIDFIFNYRLGAGFTVGGGYSYVDAQNESDDIRLEGVAQNYANFRLLYDRTWKDYSLNLSLLGRIQDEKFYEERDGKGYNLWKLTTTHRFAQVGAFKLEATAGIDNLFDYVDDRPFGVHYGTINSGRTFFIGLNIRFSK